MSRRIPMYRVARIAGRAPAISGSEDGGFVSSAMSRYGRPSRKTSTSRTMSIENPTRSENKRRPLKRTPFRRRLIGCSAAAELWGVWGNEGVPHASEPQVSDSLVHLPVLADEADREDVHHECQHEERGPDREDRLVLDRARRDVAGAGRRDERRHRLSGLARVERQLRLLTHRHEHDHRLPDSARDREHERRDDPGDG